MTQSEKAVRFAELHRRGRPVTLYNAWDAGSAKAIAAAGAEAIATSSWAVAAAQGYGDGEDIPLDALIGVASRITANLDLPVSVDFEGGYAEGAAGLATNLGRLIDAGAIGINFEDRLVKGSGLYAIDRQAARIAALRGAADAKGLPLFINARTDLFLGQGNEPSAVVDEAIARAAAYAAAGASGLFIPGLTDAALIAKIVDASPLPVNVMIMSGAPSVAQLTEIGVARISYGNIAYADAMEALTQMAAWKFAATS